MFDVRPSSPRLWYWIALVMFACGLMCKPVLVTLPFVLLLLDYWPLGRMQNAECRMQNAGVGTQQHATRNTQHAFILHLLLLEKLPFFILAAASSLVTMLAHHQLGFLNSASRFPLDTRLGNALVSYVRYLGKTVWPDRLAVFYPYPAAWPGWEVVMCGLLLLVFSGLVLGAARRRPWCPVAWFWFLGVLVPFIGLVQLGEQAMADRFMYVPIIGLLLLLVWGARELTSRWPYQTLILSAAVAAATLLCVTLTRRQVACWQNSETLFRHALASTEGNWAAHHNLANTLLQKKGPLDEAIYHAREAVRLQPAYADARNCLGAALSRKKDLDEATRQFQLALQSDPNHVEAHYNLGNSLSLLGRSDEAITHYATAARLRPDYLNAHSHLAVALLTQGRLDEAITQFLHTLRLNPSYAEAHNGLGLALCRKGRPADGIREFREALRLRPSYTNARENLATALAANTNAPSLPPQRRSD